MEGILRDALSDVALIVARPVDDIRLIFRHTNGTLMGARGQTPRTLLISARPFYRQSAENAAVARLNRGRHRKSNWPKPRYGANE